jgi:hypothetical protein
MKKNKLFFIPVHITCQACYKPIPHKDLLKVVRYNNQFFHDEKCLQEYLMKGKR